MNRTGGAPARRSWGPSDQRKNDLKQTVKSCRRIRDITSTSNTVYPASRFATGKIIGPVRNRYPIILAHCNARCDGTACRKERRPPVLKDTFAASTGSEDRPYHARENSRVPHVATSRRTGLLRRSSQRAEGHEAHTRLTLFNQQVLHPGWHCGRKPCP